jgi:hypothetical protein
MKNKVLTIILLVLFVLASCAPAASIESTNTAVPVQTTTVSNLATATLQPNTPTITPFVDENASTECFLNIDFIPGKTEMDEVITSWGNPTQKSPPGLFSETWNFDFSGRPYITFQDGVLNTVTYFLKDCSLEKIIHELGPPEKVEIIVLVSDVLINDAGGSTTFVQKFHYISLGFSYFRFCDKTKDCYTFHAKDVVDGKKFYPSNTTIEDATGLVIRDRVYNWHGFDVNVEEIEDKLEGFPMETPTP